jgi:FAD/FMN-containing dehydrogenase
MNGLGIVEVADHYEQIICELDQPPIIMGHSFGGLLTQILLDRGLGGGAHSVAGFSTVDGGVVIDTSPMQGMRVDPTGRRAVAQPGLTWSAFDHETQAFGLAITGGLVSTTGIAGFTLGGGFGWLLRKYGLTCDSLLSADVVTADGKLLTASEHEHPDLYWALRGGGGNFGVVTSLEYRLHPVGPMVFAGPVFYAGESAEQVLRGWRDLTASMADELTTLANILVAPPVPFLPEAVHGQLVVAILGVYAGSVEDGAKTAQPLRTAGLATVPARPAAPTPSLPLTWPGSGAATPSLAQGKRGRASGGRRPTHPWPGRPRAAHAGSRRMPGAHRRHR